MTSNEPHQPMFDPSLLSATAEGALEALNRAGKDAELLLEQWKSTANATALVEVAEKGSGNLRKAARRAISILKSRGVVIPERPRISSLRATQVDSHVTAYMLPPDAAGGLVAVLATKTPTHRYRTAFVYLHDEMGIRRVEAGEQSQTQLREAMARLSPGGAMRPVQVPVEWVRYRIAKARAVHQTHGIPQPLGLTTAASLLEPIPEQEPQHPLDQYQLAASESEVAEAVAKSGALHRLPEFRAWLPSRESVDELLAQVGQGVTPGAEPSQEQLSTLIEGAVHGMTDRFFAPQMRDRLIATMKDSAISVLSRDGREAATTVVAAMQAIGRCGLITNPPHEVGFLRGFFDKAIAVLLAQGQGSLQIPIRRPAPTDQKTGDAAPAGASEGSTEANADDSAPPTEVSYVSGQ